MNTYTKGQRWLSEMEPELGLGIITEMSTRRISILFPASETRREYATASAPIKRVQFAVGDEIKTTDGQTFQITAVEESDDLLTYHCGDVLIPEQQIDGLFSFSSPKDRLLGGFIDTNAIFNLRRRALHWRAQHRQSPAFGFIGARMQLIPHQLYVAQQVASRLQPRVLLSDQVGLGKTIEACLILHRLLLSRRIERVLIIVPESLVHQWFVELLRRFNLLFRIFDQEYVDSLLQADKTRNPFEDEQLILCSLDFLSANNSLHQQLVDAEWDMAVIDEAHHILEDTAEYQLVANLSRRAKGLMLLTATPEQLGRRSHFARLKLLDPSRYHDYDQFRKESEKYQNIAAIANALLAGEKLDKAQIRHLHDVLPEQLDRIDGNSTSLGAEESESLVKEIIDRYGVGRVMFRNTRAAIPNFPQRRLHLTPLDADEHAQKAARLEFQNDIGEKTSTDAVDYKADPRLLWLVKFLKSHTSKILLICNSINKVLAIESALRFHISTKYALFHEEMTLLQRDRNAAWFAEKEGAQLLICSEIGSEGRNFQFAHHLILFDMPTDPELLEQRIGRLDRIGQKQTINIWTPVVDGAPQHLQSQWYHRGFNAFERNAVAAYQIYNSFGGKIIAAAAKTDGEKVERLIAETKTFNDKTTAQLQAGRNRLLELNSFRKEPAEALKKEIKKLDSSRDFESFVIDLLQHYDVQVDETSDDLYILKADFLTNQNVPLPAYRGEQAPVAFSRKIAVSREDVEFLTPEHPTVMGAIDLLLGSETGAAVLAVWPDKQSQEFLLEAYYVLECVAPVRLHIDRFLPATPIRILVNHLGEEATKKFDEQTVARHVKNAAGTKLLENQTVRQNILPAMIKHSKTFAAGKADEIIEQKRRLADSTLTIEIERLIMLRKNNPAVSEEEIAALRAERAAMLAAIQSARLRLDSIRFIIKGQY